MKQHSKRLLSVLLALALVLSLFPGVALTATAADPVNFVQTSDEPTAAELENMETFGAFIDDALMEISKMRRGEAEAGSCVWADLDEHKKKSAFLNGIYQVFGHTQLKRKPVIKKTFADLDCRKAFLITLKGDIKTIK